ncbi:MAG: ferredoxin family protein [Zavarzinella sp.]
MSQYRLTVVLSQAPGKHPAKRSLEESIAAALIMESGLDVAVIPNLYDLGPDHTGRLYLEGVRGDFCVLTWHFPRAIFWLLDRIGIKGHFGENQLSAPNDEDEEEMEAESTNRGIGAAGDIPNRHIYCLDLRDRNTPEAFVAELKRIAKECGERRQAESAAKAPLLQLGVQRPEPANGVSANGTNGKHHELQLLENQDFTPEKLLATPNRRWYPVIDYSRCTNCLECLDFCLFGVYGVDSFERLYVESQDNCKKGCPACSRVCPEQAIMFPEYKSAAIAGAPVGGITGIKIDLSKLFGGEDADPVAQAVAERDRELVADGRTAVGATVGLPKRQENKSNAPKDDLDKLVDDLDALDL